ncbi:MAG TPA: hypothetical protein VJY35_13150 [Candidatus Eisenbacteria bacterium]|nr:hypothetical protein [Candidatus Eisenbacteria bacterium]
MKHCPATAALLALVLALGLGACSPFVEVIRMDDFQRKQARADVKQYTELPASYTAVQDLEATSCQLGASDPKATNQDAIDQLHFKASRLGANGLANVFCDSPGTFDLGKNCWTSIKCRGTAIKVSQ